MIIEYWSDFACPFCYIAETRMKKALRELDISDECRLDFKAFELNQDAPKVPKRNIVEGFSHHYGMTMEQAQAQVDRICAMGKEEGLEFNYATARGSNTFDALRLTKLAQSKGRELGDAFVERMYKAYFTENGSSPTARPFSPSRRRWGWTGRNPKTFWTGTCIPRRSGGTNRRRTTSA